MLPPADDSERKVSEDSLAQALEQRDARRRARAASNERTDDALTKAARIWDHIDPIRVTDSQTVRASDQCASCGVALIMHVPGMGACDNYVSHPVRPASGGTLDGGSEPPS